MTVFVRTDMRSITISEDHGGCGQCHEAKDGKITCPICEPILVSSHGASNHKAKAERTPDEIEQDEIDAREGQIATQRMASALATAAGDVLRDDQGHAPVTNRKGSRRATARA